VEWGRDGAWRPATMVAPDLTGPLRLDP